MNGTYTAVIDRIIDGETAVILIEHNDKVRKQFDIAVEELPTEADEGGVLEVAIAEGGIETITYLEDETESRQEAVQERFDRLSERLSDS